MRRGEEEGRVPRPYMEKAMRNVEAEEAFVKAFILLDKRERYLQMLGSPRKRGKILNSLYHTLDCVPALTTAIPSREHSEVRVIALLRAKGAGAACYLISPELDLDQQEMPLQEAVARMIVQDRTAIACCLPGRLAYYKAELSGYVLEGPLAPEGRASR